MNAIENNKPIWILPINENREYIAKNVKYHCFEGKHSLCGNYYGDYSEMETDIESGTIEQNPNTACKKCYKKWVKEFDLEVSL